MTSRPHPPIGLADTAALFVAAAAVLAGGWVWSTGEIAGWLATGAFPPVPLADAAGVLASLPAHLGQPRMAWPVWARAGLPGAAAVYGCGGVVLAPAVLLVGWCRRRRRPGRGAAWAAGPDLRPLRLTGRRRAGRLILGRTGRRLVATESRHSVLVIGPTQSGKTTGLAVPAILEWRGPVVATSVKDDLVDTTARRRECVGPCFVFNPTSHQTAKWSPLAACGSWSEAQKMASWLVDATPARSGLADAAFWYAAAAKQLAPLLMAAGRSGGGMDDLVRWTNDSDFDGPLEVLHLAGDIEAAQALTACANRDERIRSSVATTLETVLAPFEDPIVAAATGATAAMGATGHIDPATILDHSGTLYLCGPSHEQHRVQGLFAALVSVVVAEAVQRVEAARRPLDPPLLVVLDEAANIAPVRDLDTLASTAAGLGIQLVTVCQDLAQLAARYGPDRSRTIANNHRAKLLLSGVGDLTTLDLISGLAGETARQEETVTHDLRDGRRTRATATVFRRLAPTDELRRVPPGRGVLVYGHLPPAQIRLRPWFADRRLSRLARS